VLVFLKTFVYARPPVPKAKPFSKSLLVIMNKYIRFPSYLSVDNRRQRMQM
jgi:hypothetical protein